MPDHTHWVEHTALPFLHLYMQGGASRFMMSWASPAPGTPIAVPAYTILAYPDPSLVVTWGPQPWQSGHTKLSLHTQRQPFLDGLSALLTHCRTMITEPVFEVQLFFTHQRDQTRITARLRRERPHKNDIWTPWIAIHTDEDRDNLVAMLPARLGQPNAPA